MDKYQPTHMAVAFDTKAPTFRHELSAIYKGDRPPMPEELAEQVPYIHRMIEAMGIPLLAIEGVEADDIIGTLPTAPALKGIMSSSQRVTKTCASWVTHAWWWKTLY